jgi:hypothetical protein
LNSELFRIASVWRTDWLVGLRVGSWFDRVSISHGGASERVNSSLALGFERASVAGVGVAATSSVLARETPGTQANVVDSDSPMEGLILCNMLVARSSD